jgi:hypothetical protein
MLVGGKTEKEGKWEIHSPLHPYTIAPEWNSLCWLGESEREEKKGEKLSFQREKNENFLDP